MESGGGASDGGDGGSGGDAVAVAECDIGVRQHRTIATTRAVCRFEAHFLVRVVVIGELHRELEFCKSGWEEHPDRDISVECVHHVVEFACARRCGVGRDCAEEMVQAVSTETCSRKMCAFSIRTNLRRFVFTVATLSCRTADM